MSSRRLHSGLCLLVLIAVAAMPARGQELQGALSFSTEAGYLSNPFLDASTAYWDPAFRASYGALSPSGQLLLTGRRSSLQLAGTGRYLAFADGAAPWYSGTLHLRARRSFSSTLSAGLDAGASTFRGMMHQETYRLLPYLRWSPTGRIFVRARAGIARQQSHWKETSDTWQSTSLLTALEVHRWIGARSRAGLSAHAARTQLEEGADPLQGLGGALHLAHWLRSGAVLRAEFGLDHYGYEAALEGAVAGQPPSPESQYDVLWRAAFSGEWPISAAWSLVARLGGARLQTSVASATTHDVQAGLGLRFSLSESLYRPPEPLPVWKQEGEALYLRLRYEGDGELYVVGDFNGWSAPGHRMTRISNDVYGIELHLDPGAYHYRVREVSGTDERWLRLPDHALTVTDDFGGRNGLLIVEPAAAITDE